MTTTGKSVVVPFKQSDQEAPLQRPESAVEAFYGAEGGSRRSASEAAEDGFFALAFDMASSSAIAEASSELFPEQGARLFEAEVRDLTARACIGFWDDLLSPAVFLGDGGNCAFASARAAHGYAEALHSLARQRNSRVVSEGRWWRFRIGIGGLEFETDDFEFRVRDRANVLELNAMPGGTLIDEHAYCSLPPSIRKLYGDQERIEGKRIYQGYRRS
ncbi:MAG: hypothetical protein AAF401_13545 [Pseudomonadota bacterium]